MSFISLNKLNTEGYLDISSHSMPLSLNNHDLYSNKWLCDRLHHNNAVIDNFGTLKFCVLFLYFYVHKFEPWTTVL